MVIYSILKTLQERIEERESHPGAEQNREKNAWEAFWEEWGPALLLYACAYGTVDAVKLLLDMKCPLHYKRQLRRYYIAYQACSCSLAAFIHKLRDRA